MEQTELLAGPFFVLLLLLFGGGKYNTAKYLKRELNHRHHLSHNLFLTTALPALATFTVSYDCGGQNLGRESTRFS